MKRGIYVFVFFNFSSIYKTYKPLFPSGKKLFYKFSFILLILDNVIVHSFIKIIRCL